MTPENFAYWLQGFSEICGQTPSKEQWEIIKDHLNLVFNKVTPNRVNTTYCGQVHLSSGIKNGDIVYTGE